MKKFAKILPYLIIIACVVFITLTLLKVDERADALAAQVESLTAENTALQTANGELTAALTDADDLLAVKEAELAETTTRLEQAEATLTEVLATVQAIRTELNALPAEPAEEEVPAEEAAEVPAEEVAEEVPAE